MPYLETPDGVPLYYEDHGSGNTVLLIHGWTMNAEYWWQNTPELANSQRLVVLDLRGHGLSGKTDEGHTLAQYARDVRHLITALDLDGVTPVGWSMGTAVILNYLIQFGDDRLHSVVFVDRSYKDLHPALSRVTVPALLIYGAHSAIFPGDLGAWLHQQIPNSKLVMFEQSDHCPFSEEPEKFNREVAAFVG